MRAWLNKHAAAHASHHSIAKILVITGLIRTLAWTTLIVMYLAGVSFTASLFKSVAFVAIISLYANAATDFGQSCASLAELSASNAHAEAEKAKDAATQR